MALLPGGSCSDNRGRMQVDDLDEYEPSCGTLPSITYEYNIRTMPISMGGTTKEAHTLLANVF